MPANASPAQKCLAALEQNRFGQAEKLARRIADPDDRDTLLIRVYCQKGDDNSLSSALTLIEALVARENAPAQIHLIRIELALHRADLTAASAAVDAAMTAFPAEADWHGYRAVVSHLSAGFEAALPDYQASVHLQNAGRTLSDVELNIRVGLRAVDTVAGNYPGSPARDQFHRVDALAERDYLLAALESATEQAFPPANLVAQAWFRLGASATFDYGRVREGLSCFAHADQLAPGDASKVNRLALLNYSDDVSPHQIADEHLRFGAWVRSVVGPPVTTFPNRKDPQRALRIGCLSADFREHSVAYFLEPVLAARNRQAFEVVCYFYHEQADARTTRIQMLADKFHNVSTLDAQALLKKIASDRIHILVDLQGLTTGSRIDVLAKRAAPVQMTWIGYPNTTGIDTVDYRIVDRITDPHDSPDAFYSERRLRMPGPFSVYQAPEQLLDIAVAATNSPSSEFKFGSFNNPAKMSDTIVRCWAEILSALPQSKVLLKYRTFEYATPAERLWTQFEEFGVDRRRVILRRATPTLSAHFATYREIDLALDTFPYNGTTTNCECLLMGVPVLTLTGTDHRSRVTTSQLEYLGLGDFIAASPDAYVAKAIEFATTRKSDLHALRTTSREQFLASSLCDAASLAGALEQHFRQSWQRWCSP